MSPRINSYVHFLIPFAALAFLGQGCLGGGAKPPTGPDAGLWKTADRGLTWVNKKALVTGTKVTADVATYAVTSITLDPQDSNAVYFGTIEHGLVYSLDGGESWRQSKTLPIGRVNAVAVDSKNKCIVYAAMANKIFKTENCLRDWEQVFFDPRTDKIFTQIAIDWFNPTILYAGTSDGDVFKSVDAGRSWQVVKRVEGVSINTIAIDSRDSRLILVGTQGEGIWKTLDGGSTWQQIKKQFGEDFSEARRTTQVVLDPKDSNVIYSVSKYGIIKSGDQGENWTALPLTSPPGSIKITSLAIDPTDSSKLVYTGPATLAYSSDAGNTWTIKKLPTTQGGAVLRIDPKKGDVIYLGTQPTTKK